MLHTYIKYNLIKTKEKSDDMSSIYLIKVRNIFKYM